MGAKPRRKHVVHRAQGATGVKEGPAAKAEQVRVGPHQHRDSREDVTPAGGRGGTRTIESPREGGHAGASNRGEDDGGRPRRQPKPAHRPPGRRQDPRGVGRTTAAAKSEVLAEGSIFGERAPAVPSKRVLTCHQWRAQQPQAARESGAKKPGRASAERTVT